MESREVVRKALVDTLRYLKASVLIRGGPVEKPYPGDWYGEIAEAAGVDRSQAKKWVWEFLEKGPPVDALLLMRWRYGEIEDDQVDAEKAEIVKVARIQCRCGVLLTVESYEWAESDEILEPLETDAATLGWRQINDEVVCPGCARIYDGVVKTWGIG